MSDRLSQISDATGFADGFLFRNVDEVRAYFTVENQRLMFGEDAIVDQDALDVMADAVIANRWHYAPTSTVEDAIRDLERDDVLACREELLRTGRLTDTAGGPLVLIDESGEALSAARAVARIDFYVDDSARDGDRDAQDHR